MKVYEIVREEKTTEGVIGGAAKLLGKSIFPWGKTVSAADVAPAHASKAATIRASLSTYQDLGKIPVIGRWLLKRQVAKDIAKFNIARAEVIRSMTNNFGTWMIRLLTMYNIYDAVGDFYTAKSLLNPNDPEYQTKLNELTGLFWTRLLVPGIAAGGAKLLGGVAKIIPGLATMFGPGTVIPVAGVAVKAAIDMITKAGTGYIIYKLSTDEGKKIMTDFIGNTVISGIGNLAPDPDKLLSGAMDLLKFLYVGVVDYGIKGQRPTKDAEKKDSGPSAQGASSSTPSGGGSPFGGSMPQDFDDIAAMALKKTMGF